MYFTIIILYICSFKIHIQFLLIVSHITSLDFTFHILMLDFNLLDIHYPFIKVKGPYSILLFNLKPSYHHLNYRIFQATI